MCDILSSTGSISDCPLEKKKLTAPNLRGPQTTSWETLVYCIRQGKQSTYRGVLWTWSVWLPKNNIIVQKLDLFPPSSDREWGATTELDRTQRATLHPNVSATDGNIQKSKRPRPCFTPVCFTPFFLQTLYDLHHFLIYAFSFQLNTL
jgi:hypothetical protein